jgi:hypothetical protein
MTEYLKLIWNKKFRKSTGSCSSSKEMGKKVMAEFLNYWWSVWLRFFGIMKIEYKLKIISKGYSKYSYLLRVTM